MFVRIVLLCLVWSTTWGQVAKPANYLPGTVWAKLKSEYRSVLGSPTGRGGLSLNTTSIRPFVKQPLPVSGRSGPKKQAVDVSLYYTINFDALRPVDDFIEELYATGYFEIR